MGMIKSFLKKVAGLLLLPVCVGVSYAFYEHLGRIRAVTNEQKYFLYGAIVYLIVHTLFFRPDYLYVLGHEVMHVVATWISGGRVTSFRVTARGGHVRTTKSNIFIALAPYFIPFYTILIVVIFWGVSLIMYTKASYNIFLWLVGFSLALHIVLTVDFLKTKQTDLLHAGYLTSNCLIYIVNLSIICLIFGLLFREINFFRYVVACYDYTRDIYASLFKNLFMW
ncbi:MAG: hypothetical protein ABIB11_06515 [Candidatus Omnitrophota bacterium]